MMRLIKPNILTGKKDDTIFINNHNGLQYITIHMKEERERERERERKKERKKEIDNNKPQAHLQGQPRHVTNYNQ